MCVATAETGNAQQKIGGDFFRFFARPRRPGVSLFGRGNVAPQGNYQQQHN
jgi:hypothetical protein